MNVSEEYKITAGTISGANFVSVDIEPSIIVDGKSYTASEFNKAVEMLKQPQLNENQKIVLDWLKEEHFVSYVKSVMSNLYFYINMTAIGDLENTRIQEMVNAYEKLSQGEFAQVIEVFSRWAQEQEEE
ncbi:hypothetical protein [Enterococcus gallinarum]|uniref:hypothetical protein n=1 Tax=Enterococcus gallinarum TaxID=1353 RepID=UPI0012E17B03|nr:hypothetical protein [Enterococcus gallinarum]MUO33091.1 hypothetical protein [Enterococcus gallinarum]